jgi:hypothetical protein
MRTAISPRLAFPWADDLLARVPSHARAIAKLRSAFAEHR